MSKPIRDLAIDRYRGVLVIIMVIGNYLSGVALVPAFLKHTPDIGFTIADLVAPAFVFVIGLNFGPSFARRSAQGFGPAYRYFGLRYLSLIGIGAIIAAGATATGQPTDWGVLQALGIAGLIAVLFIRLATWTRFIIGLAMLIAYQFVLDSSQLSSVLHSAHGGLFGSVSWAGLLVLATAVADVWRRGLLRYLICVAVLIAGGVVAAVVIPVSKNRVSLSYILVTLALSAILLLVFEGASRLAPSRAGLMCWWGENALALYIAHLLVLALFVTPPISWWYVDASLPLVLAQIIVILAVLSALAWWLHRRKVRR